MASQQMQAFLDAKRDAPPKKQVVPTEETRRELDDYMSDQPAADGFNFENVIIGDCPARRFSPETGTADSAILYLHGGGYYTGSSKSHHALMSHLCVASGAPVIGLDYRLAPEHPYPAALNDAVAAYWALTEDISASRIMIAGDSAGGGLTMACLHHLRDTSKSLPGCAALLSANVDLSATGAFGGWNLESQNYYAGSYPRDHPGISPVFGNMQGLPPVLVQFASDEAFVDEVERLIEKLKAANVDVTVQSFQDAFHAFQMFTMIPESMDAIQQIADFFQSRVRETS